MPDEDPLASATLRRAWANKYAQEPSPWRGPPDAGPALLALGERVGSGGRVLECGAGGGKTRRALARLGARVFALDWVGGALAGPDAVAADATCLPLRSGAFDGVVAYHLLEHLPADSRERFVREAARILAPGGVLALRAFAVGDLREGKGELAELGSYLRDGGLLYHYFTTGEISRLFSGWGALLAPGIHAREERHGGRRIVRARVEAAYLRPDPPPA